MTCSSEAARAFQDCIAQDRWYHRAWYGLAQLHRRNGRETDAQQALEIDRWRLGPRAGALQQEVVAAEGRTWTALTLTDGTMTGADGAPGLPIWTGLVIVPEGAHFEGVELSEGLYWEEPEEERPAPAGVGPVDSRAGG